MPPLKNARHERFAQELAKGKSATEAYALAGFKSNDGNAARLKGNDRILQRLSELQGNASKKAEITVQSLADELEEARAIAIAEKQSSAAVSATMGKAKLFGLGVEKRQVSGTLQLINITPKQIGALSNDELAALEAAYPVLEKLGLVATGDPSGTPGEGGEPED